MTRSPGKTTALRKLGAEPVICDVFDASALTQAVIAFGAQLVMHPAHRPARSSGPDR
jgi:hypothetical protein